jgi:chitin synthase
MSSVSAAPSGVTRQGVPQNHQVSTQTLLNALHNSYLNHQPHTLESSTSLVVNTWQTALQVTPDGRTGGTVDQKLAERAWQHARRRAEDGSIVLGYVWRLD